MGYAGCARLDETRCDAILLDVDNGPDAGMLAGHAVLYSAAGLRRLHAVLMLGGRPAVWLVDHWPVFEARLDASGLDWRRLDVPGRGAPDDPIHPVYPARKVEYRSRRRWLGKQQG